MSTVRKLTPSLTRITFSGPDLQYVATEGLDQRIKVVFPLDGLGFSHFGMLETPPLPVSEWYGQWRTLDNDRRNPMRTYTLRNPKPEAQQVDIDFVLHGDAGPASAWALGAKPGDEIVIFGPDGRATDRGGIEWRPGNAREVLLAGDETAWPAICAIVESLPAGITGHAFIEVPHPSDAVEVPTDSDVTVSWLARGDARRGELLDTAVRAWAADHVEKLAVSAASAASAASEAAPTFVDDTPTTDDIVWTAPDLDADMATSSDTSLYTWLAGESKVITTLRRHLVRDAGFDRNRVAFMGYWREGRAEN